MKILSIFNIHQVNNMHTFKYIYMLMLDYGKYLSFRTVYRYFKRFSCQLFKWFSKNIHPRKKLQLWDMMSNLLPVIFCSGPVYIYAIHIVTSNLLFLGQILLGTMLLLQQNCFYHCFAAWFSQCNSDIWFMRKHFEILG